MAIESIYSFLVMPSKNEAVTREIGGAELPLTGKVFDMLNRIYDRASIECRIEITFNPDALGRQSNDARNILLKFLGTPSLEVGRAVAARLQGLTDKRSGRGLLFLIVGREGKNHTLLVSRFPADEGIVAEQTKEAFNVEFLEYVFLKSATAYKAAYYCGTNLKSGFWDGCCVDKQINSEIITISDYWIKQFLASDFKTTPAQGTARVAKAIKKAIKESVDPKAKEELFAMARLAGGSNKKTVSAKSLAKQFVLSTVAEATLKNQFPGVLYAEKFKMDGAEYQRHITFQSIELNNGGILTAEAPKFDQVFKREELVGMTRFSTEGKIVDERIRTSKL